MTRRELRRDKKGQFVVLISLGIVMAMVALSSLLAYTALSPVHFPDTDFREAATEVDLNFRRGLAVALADASKELEHKASTVRYVNITRLEDYPEAEKVGWEFIAKWHNTTLMKHAGLGINISISTPVFECNWGSDQGYSKAEANMSFDIMSYGFYGWDTQAIVEVNTTILGLKETDGNRTSFFFIAKKEFGVPITELTASQTRVLFRKSSGTFRSTVVTEVTYFGGGTYLGTYLLEYYTDMLPILDELNLLKYEVEKLGSDSFKPESPPDVLYEKINASINQYTVMNYNGTYDKLLHDIRPHLDNDPSTEQTWVYEWVDTSRCLVLIDDILSQLFPRIKLFLNDPRGITVGAYATLSKMENDTLGPRINEKQFFITPNPVIGSDSATLTAEFTDSQSNILCAEYFIQTPGTDGYGIPLGPTDGSFDSPIERASAEINVTGWAPGNYTIYVHARDTEGNWGNLEPITLTLLENLRMHIKSMDVTPGGKIYVYVAIVDARGHPVEDAEVEGSWDPTDLLRRYVESARTDDDGVATFWANVKRDAHGTITFTVEDVTKSGWIYDSSANEVVPPSKQVVV